MVNPTWWREASVYQIYPASFCDSNGDGFGDLEGIISKVDYISSLGVDVVWLSPINKSPQVDMGYDISDYKDIDPRYGTLETVERLIAQLKKRGIKFVLDLVVNHTSDQHAWFTESRSSKSNPKRDWYVWKPARYDNAGNRQPPNNWTSYFTESAWKWDEETQEYYLCLFADEQPDLNWENPQVRDAVHDVVRFWLDRGVSGFRLDVINFISKDQAFPDAPGDNQYNWGYMYYANGPRLHEYLNGLGKIFKEYDAFSVGEMPHVQDSKEILKVVGEDRGELHMIFQFDLVSLDNGAEKYDFKAWTLQDLKEAVRKWQEFLPSQGGWNAVFIENHDQPRAISRYLHASTDLERDRASKLMAMFIVFQCGTPFVYQGQELGLANIPADVPIEKYEDLESLNYWHRFLATNPSPQELEVKREQFNLKARDNARTPMHWKDTKHGGFTEGEPWMFVTDDVRAPWNAEAQTKDEDSPLKFWSKCLQLRRQHKEVVVYGDFKMTNYDDSRIVAWERTTKDDKFIVVLNFTKQPAEFTVQGVITEVVVSNAEIKLGKTILLGPFEGFVAKLK